jgi:hypothetical protein
MADLYRIGKMNFDTVRDTNQETLNYVHKMMVERLFVPHTDKIIKLQRHWRRLRDDPPMAKVKRTLRISKFLLLIKNTINIVVN